jgi:hypothetical protein
LRIEYRDDDAPDIYTDDVCFDDSCWQRNVKATHKHPEHAPFSESANPEIIGNIYEHPHYSPMKNKNAVARGRRGGKAKSQTYPRRAEGDNGEGARKRLAFKDSHPQEAMPISGMQNY